MKNWAIFGLVAISFAAVSARVRITPCKSGGGSAQYDVSTFNISGCGPPNRPQRNCLFQKGTNAQMTLPFTPAGAVTSVRTKVHGILVGIPIPFPLPNEDGCSAAGGGLTCPLAPGQAVTYSTQLPVSKNYPSLSLKVRWQLIDENNRDLVCIEFPVQLK